MGMFVTHKRHAWKLGLKNIVPRSFSDNTCNGFCKRKVR